MGNKENNIKKPGFKTLSIHHGETFAEETGCVMPPIFSTSTFKHGNKDNFDYTRSGNPNFRILESVLKSIEDSKYLSLIHISEPTRRTPISYAVFCLKKKKRDLI